MPDNLENFWRVDPFLCDGRAESCYMAGNNRDCQVIGCANRTKHRKNIVGSMFSVITYCT